MRRRLPRGACSRQRIWTRRRAAARGGPLAGTACWGLLPVRGAVPRHSARRDWLLAHSSRFGRLPRARARDALVRLRRFRSASCSFSGFVGLVFGRRLTARSTTSRARTVVVSDYVKSLSGSVDRRGPVRGLPDRGRAPPSLRRPQAKWLARVSPGPFPRCERGTVRRARVRPDVRCRSKWSMSYALIRSRRGGSAAPTASSGGKFDDLARSRGRGDHHPSPSAPRRRAFVPHPRREHQSGPRSAATPCNTPRHTSRNRKARGTRPPRSRNGRRLSATRH